MGGLSVKDLVFLDEMAILLGMMRLRGRSPQGERLYDSKPFYRGSRVSVVGAISHQSILALKAIDQSMTGEQFKTFLREDLAPKLWEGAVVVMDNLAAHKVKGVEEILESVGARVIYLSPYSPKYNPIEHLWWSLKALIRQFVPKTAETVAQLLQLGAMLESRFC
ncbi:MAG: IS630 family transposase [Leptolyngbyaceae cyanobacterium RM1_406_9]|nr:IS630 family transposase [Leptolyngbyaceae cyanobacterium RM1_406_9]